LTFIQPTISEFLPYFNPYQQVLLCFLHNSYLGVFKELLRITLERIMDDDKKVKKSESKGKKKGRHGGLNRIREIQKKIIFFQNAFNRFHRKDVRIKPLLKSNGTLNITNWEGNDCIAFSHIAMLVFSSVLSPLNKLKTKRSKEAQKREKTLKTLEIWWAFFYCNESYLLQAKFSLFHRNLP